MGGVKGGQVRICMTLNSISMPNMEQHNYGQYCGYCGTTTDSVVLRCRRFRNSSLLTAYGTHGPNLCRYSLDMMNALTISALTKLPLNWFSLFNQKL